MRKKFIVIANFVFLNFTGYCQKQKIWNLDFTMGSNYFIITHKIQQPLVPFTPGSTFYEKSRTFLGFQAGLSSIFKFKSKLVLSSSINFQLRKGESKNDSLSYSILFPDVDRFEIQTKGRSCDLQFNNSIGYKLNQFIFSLELGYDFYSSLSILSIYNTKEKYQDKFVSNVHTTNYSILVMYDFGEKYKNSKISFGIINPFEYEIGAKLNLHFNLYNYGK